MGEVAVTLKVMPESPEVDLEALKEAIKNAVDEKEFERIEEEPIGFGLLALIVTVSECPLQLHVLVKTFSDDV